MTEIHFKGIQNIVIGKLKNAQQKVSIAVAWFTNEAIFSELLILLDRKVDISLVILDDYINNGPFGLNFAKFIDNGGKLFYSTIENPVHHKFCIIDESYVLSGSYNWTYYAEFKNYENEVLLTDKNFIDGYNYEFNKIIRTLTQQNEAIRYSEFISSKFDLYSQKEYLANDILIRGINYNNLDLIEQAKNLNPTNTDFVQMASTKVEELKMNVKLIAPEVSKPATLEISKPITPKVSKSTTLEVSKPVTPEVSIPVAPNNSTNHQQYKPLVTKVAYGISSRINGIDDRFAIILNKGEHPPIVKSSMFYTVNDNQTQISVDTYKGDNLQASKNLLLGKILIKDLPPLPAGKASIEVTFSIDIKGVLNVKVISTLTGNILEANYYNTL